MLLDTSWWCSTLQSPCYDCSLPPGQDVIRWLPTLLGCFNPEPQRTLRLLGQEGWPITAHRLLTSWLKSSADSIFHTECAGEQQLPTSTGNSQLCHPVSLHWKGDKGLPDRVQYCTPPVCAAMCLFLLIMCTVGPPFSTCADGSVLEGCHPLIRAEGLKIRQQDLLWQVLLALMALYIQPSSSKSQRLDWKCWARSVDILLTPY